MTFRFLLLAPQNRRLPTVRCPSQAMAAIANQLPTMMIPEVSQVVRFVHVQYLVDGIDRAIVCEGASRVLHGRDSGF